MSLVRPGLAGSIIAVVSVMVVGIGGSCSSVQRHGDDGSSEIIVDGNKVVKAAPIPASEELVSRMREAGVIGTCAGFLRTARRADGRLVLGVGCIVGPCSSPNLQCELASYGDVIGCGCLPPNGPEVSDADREMLETQYQRCHMELDADELGEGATAIDQLDDVCGGDCQGGGECRPITIDVTEGGRQVPITVCGCG